MCVDIVAVSCSLPALSQHSHFYFDRFPERFLSMAGTIIIRISGAFITTQLRLSAPEGRVVGPEALLELCLGFVFSDAIAHIDRRTAAGSAHDCGVYLANIFDMRTYQ